MRALLAIPTVVTVLFTLLSVAMLIAGHVDRALVSLLVALLSLSVAVPVAAFGSEEGTQLKRRHTPF
jgi:hypothetical protein